MADKSERFTQRARRVLQLAQQEAKYFYHPEIEAIHMFIALVKEEGGVSSRILRELNIDADRLYKAFDLPDVPIQVPDLTDVVLPTLSANVRRTLELAVDEARRMKHYYIGTEHLPLGVLQLQNPTIQTALTQLQVDQKQIRENTVELLQAHEGRVEAKNDDLTTSIPELFKSLSRKVAEPPGLPEMGRVGVFCVGGMVFAENLYARFFENDLTYQYAIWIVITMIYALLTCLMAHPPRDFAHILRLAQLPKPAPQADARVLMFATGTFASIFGIQVLLNGQGIYTIPQLQPLVSQSDFAALLLASLFVLLIQPIAEEIVYRGVVYPTFAEFRVWVGITVSAILYTLFYLYFFRASYSSDWGLVWYTTLIPLLTGIALGVVRAFSHSTRLCIYLRSAFNLIWLIPLWAN